MNTPLSHTLDMVSIRSKYRDRASTAFERARTPMNDELNAMLSRFAAQGRTGAGATIKQAIRIYEAQTAAALTSVLEEAGRLIEHRGRSWNFAMEGIGDALNEQLRQAPNLIANPLRIGNRGGRPDDDASKRAQELLDESGDRLRARLDDFRNGWTAPAPKHWKDRNPIWYAIILLLIGAIVGQALREL